MALLQLHSQVDAASASTESADKEKQVRQLLDLRRRQQEQALRESKLQSNFRFSDRTLASGITFRHECVDDAGKNWKPAHYDHGNGVAVADVDGDGLLDLYFTTQLGSNRLYRNLGNATFKDITSEAGVGLSDQISVAAAFADIDNDGDPDLYVTTVRHGNHLFENRGNNRFVEVTESAGLSYSGHSSGAVFMDVDRDGLIDLFLCNVGKFTLEQKGHRGFYLARENAFAAHLQPELNEQNLLYRNLGNLRFKEVSKEWNIMDTTWSGDATQLDPNQDGFPDLYVANMQGQDRYYENQGGKRFEDRTDSLFPRTPWGAMGVKSFDLNNDGRMDLLVTDMHSDMTEGQRRRAMGFDPRVERQKTEAYCGPEFANVFELSADRYVFGNALYQAQAGGGFIERSDALGLETYWPWGISAGDLNADGYEDLVISAGMGFPFRYAVNSVLLNDAGKRFRDAEFQLGVEPRADGKVEIDYFTLDCDGIDKGHRLCEGQSGTRTIRGPTSSRSSALLDLDDDGDLDIVLNDFNDRPQLLVSNLSERQNIGSLKLRLRGTRSNRDGLGASVKLTTSQGVFHRYHDGKSGYLAQSSSPLHFGFSADSKVMQIEVKWPSGLIQTLKDDLPQKGTFLITEGP